MIRTRVDVERTAYVLRGGPQAGSSLLSAMMAVVIFGFLVIVINFTLVNGTARAVDLTLRNDERELRNFLSFTVDCTATKTLKPSCSGGSLALVDRQKRVLVAADGSTSYGRYWVRAKCAAGQIEVEFARGAPRHDLQFPYKNLYPRGPFACRY